MNTSNDYFDHLYRSYLIAHQSSGWNIETGFRCRLQCPYCQRSRPNAQQNKIKKATDISTKTFIKCLNATRKITLCGQISDPLYHPKLLKFLEIKSKDFPNTTFDIHTNGSGKKMEWWEKAYALSDKKTRWVFGLDGASQETANQYRIGTSFDNVLEAMKLGTSRGINIDWQFILFKHNDHEIDKAKEIARKYNINFHLLYSNRWPSNSQGLMKSDLQDKNNQEKYKVYVRHKK